MDDTQRTSTWREKFEVHPAADVFPMMSDEEFAALGADIKANGLKEPIAFCWVETGTSAAHRELCDGRNRLEAMERVGIQLRVRASGLPESLNGKETWVMVDGDPVAFIISKNIHRRHLTKQQQADLIVAAVKAGADPSPSWRGVTADPAKTAAVEAAKDHGISKRTVERAFAKAEGKVPAKPKRRSKAEIAADNQAHVMAMAEGFGNAFPIEAVRHAYLVAYLRTAEERVVDLDAEQRDRHRRLARD